MHEVGLTLNCLHASETTQLHHFTDGSIDEIASGIDGLGHSEDHVSGRLFPPQLRSVLYVIEPGVGNVIVSTARGW